MGSACQTLYFPGALHAQPHAKLQVGKLHCVCPSHHGLMYKPRVLHLTPWLALLPAFGSEQLCWEVYEYAMTHKWQSFSQYESVH